VVLASVFYHQASRGAGSKEVAETLYALAATDCVSQVKARSGLPSQVACAADGRWNERRSVSLMRFYDAKAR
jgi:hypothetical protein